MKLIKKIIINVLIFFFGSTIFVAVLYKFVNPPLTPLMLVRYVENPKVGLTKKWKPIEEISPNMYNAVIASEDNLFMQHNGFDLKAIREAKKYNKKHKGKRTHGASTISQQTAKNVFLWTQRSYFRKALEVYFTFLIEQVWGKKRIMEVYLNVLETGNGVYGVEAASQIYFNKSSSKLTASQAAMIAACIPSPRKRNPARPSSYLYGRQAKILGLMNKIERVNFK